MLVAIFAGCGGPTLDRDGGYVLTYRVQPGEDVDTDAMVNALRDRLRAANVHSGLVRPLENGEFAIELPGVSQQEVAKVQGLLAIDGELELRIVADSQRDASTVEEARASGASEADGWKWVNYDADPADLGPEVVSRQSDTGRQEVMLLVAESDIASEDLSSARHERDSSLKPCIAGTLTAVGAAKMRELTGENVQRRLGIVMDGRLITAPLIQSHIGDRFQITGNFTEEEVDGMVAALRAGKLPATLDTENVTVRRVNPK